MARRRLLSDEQMAPFWAWASDEREIVRHYTLSAVDIKLVAKRRAGANRLGFAVLLCGMPFPGRVLDVHETPPAPVLAFIADQVGVPACEFAAYRQRATNRREHIAELTQNLGCRAFDKETARDLTAFAVSLAQGTPRLERLIAAVIDETRKRRVLLPTPRAIDLLCQQARVRSEALLYRALTTRLTDATRKSLDGLLEIVPDTATTRLSWLRNASQSPAPANILGLIERIQFLRKLGVDADRRQAIPSGAFDRIARDAMKITVQHVAETIAPRRHALLVAAALSLETGLTDATLLMFDKLMGSLSRKAERKSQQKAASAARDLQEKLRVLTDACTAVIRARDTRGDPFIAIEQHMRMGWNQFVASVQETFFAVRRWECHRGGLGKVSPPSSKGTPINLLVDHVHLDHGSVIQRLSRRPLLWQRGHLDLGLGKVFGALAEEVRFAQDSPLEGDGFELPVPREKKSRNLGIPLEFN